jgi:hypothetical protein
VIDKVDAVVQTRSEACVSRWYLEDKGIHKEMFAAMTREKIFFLPPSLCTYTFPYHMRQGCVVPVQLFLRDTNEHSPSGRQAPGRCRCSLAGNTSGVNPSRYTNCLCHAPEGFSLVCYIRTCGLQINLFVVDSGLFFPQLLL